MTKRGPLWKKFSLTEELNVDSLFFKKVRFVKAFETIRDFSLVIQSKVIFLVAVTL